MGVNNDHRRFSFSLRTLVLSFVLLLLAVLAALSWILSSRLDDIRLDYVRDLASEQREELAHVYQGFVDRVQEVARDLSRWEELRSTLIDPTYYEYWESSRALRSPRTPAFIDSVALYDASGDYLRQSVVPALPARVTQADLTPYVVSSHGLNLLRAVLEVKGRGRRLGYVLVQTELIPALRNFGQFNRVDPATLSLSLAPGSRLPAVGAVPYLTHRTPPPVYNTEQTRPVMLRALVEGALVISVLGLAFWVLFRQYVIVPARNLAEQIDSIDAEQKPRRAFAGSLPTKELDKVRVSLRGLQSRFDQMHRRLAESNKELWELAHRDVLTSLPNRRAFETEYGRQEKHAAHHLACVLFDCNEFKAINDTYAHETGDIVLSELAMTLAFELRGRATLYRLGGDEFIAILRGADVGGSLTIAESCASAVAAIDFDTIGIAEPVRMSIGLARKDAGAVLAISELRRRADIAMYRAKRPGLGGICEYRPEMEKSGAHLVVSLSANTAVREALSHHECLQLHCQSIVTQSGQNHWREVLARIDYRGQLWMPGEFLPVVEQRRLEPEFDSMVLERLAAILRQPNCLESEEGISVNLSGASLSAQSIQHDLLSLASATDRPLLLEVTETALIPQIDQAAKTLIKLREAGWQIALDDFGTGYSSLSKLTDLPVDIVKFDRNLVVALDSDGPQAEVVRKLASMVRGAGFELVAEGIETSATLHAARAAGFDYFQGFHIEKPHLYEG